MKRTKKRIVTFLIIAIAIAAVFVFIKFFNGNGIYISTGMGKDVLAKVDGQKTYTMDAAVLMSDARSQYEEMFTSSIWSQQIDGKTFEEYVKDQIRVKLIRVRCMNAMAKEKGIVLGREEKDGVKKAVEKYYNALTEEQRSRYNITEDKLISLKELQQSILSVVQAYVKQGGIMMYSTCTINSEENEANADWLCKEYGFKKIEYRQILPGKNGGTDGFFVAKLRRE